MVWALLISLAFAEEPNETRHRVDWWATPTADTLNPTLPTYILRHRELMDLASAGPGASPVYRDVWTRMEVYNTLLTHNLSPTPLTVDQAERARDLALATAVLGAQLLVEETLREAPLLSVGWRVTRSFTAPSLEVKQTDEGLKLSANQQLRPTFGELEQARAGELAPVLRPPGGGINATNVSYATNVTNATGVTDATDATGPARPPPRRPPEPTLRLGATGRLTTLDPDREDAPLWYTVSAWSQLSQLGLDAMRLSVDLAQIPLKTPQPSAWSWAWTVSARQSLTRRLVLTGEARSVPGAWTPQTLRVGVSTPLVAADPAWVLRLSHSEGLVGQGAAPPERRIELRLIYNGAWRAPLSPSAWPLGQVPDAPLAWPQHPGYGPNPTSPKADAPVGDQAARLASPG
ncbi:hypothetical protein L6R49_17620 [Myxococcota bacterium]|nr:hypothetical protein [Myxococcota bacterium]